MKFYDSLGPNPRLVRLFMLEKGIDVPKVQLDILGGENRRAPYTDRNPSGQVPSLELDDGTFLAETVAICEYLEELHPTPALIGATPQERAVSRMWTRRVELWITEPLANGFRYGEGLAMFKSRMRVMPQASDDLKALAREGVAKLDAQMAGRNFIAGNKLTLADPVLYAFLDFGTGVGQPIDPEQKNVAAWFARMAARPSAEASIHPVAKAANMRG
jgi:glutathione S-transferase